MVPNTRREFLADVGRGMLVASSHARLRLGLASARPEGEGTELGKLEPSPLCCRTPTNKLMLAR